MTASAVATEPWTAGRAARISAGSLLVGMAMAVMLVAGSMKLLDLETFRRSLLTWRYLSDWLIDVLWVGLPAAEAVIPVLWLFGVRRRAMERTMAAILVSMLTVIGVHWLRGEQPTCKCLGALSGYLSLQSETRFLLLKTSIVLGAMFCGHLLLLADRGIGPAPRGRTPSAHASSLRAFTLVESLLAIVIVALLVSLTLAGLSGARAQARRTQTLALLQQHGGVLAVYAVDWHDFFPAFIDAANPPYAFEVEGENVQVPLYFAAPNLWPWALRDRYYAGQPSEIFSDASDTGVLPSGRGTFDMTCTLFATPDFWAPESRLAGISQLRGVRHSDVTFPAQKATLISQYPLFKIAAYQGNVLPNPSTLTVRIPTLAADGHAESVSARRFTPGVHMGDAVFDVPGITMHWQDMLVGLHTSKGVRGTDWK